MKTIKITLLLVAILLAITTYNYQKVISVVLLPQYIEWAHDIEIDGLKIGKPLNARELGLASEIGIRHPEKVRIVYVDEVPFPRENFALKTLGEALGFIGEGIVNNAQVFGYSIYVRQGFDLNRPKLAHELVHVLQIERSDLDTIVTQHFSDLAKYGYDNSPLEVEAFKANTKYSDDW
ncbi:hypothetical protein [Pseudoalteromonas luteoviolacea]|uniref:DUF4157 domain-containing protein n=1 Tax=Pseudoalteromonas luteoviolacea S4054 TaxID=1129367 RepID=A0A0F6AEA0_9GAMM|nr:hypothetical protein [Pseudoalteromonas luteoviolacea]AOT11193.1 hypothetical protein S4054249_25540 [Pseudoalteromonas luteoviolacea]AOT15643.1 hypothetical protein S40542_22970 [Pseudoalteromonas luteoviolacea]AOT21014.1 hypothetical protein S4054_25460 [Pseudoalteromonas luteoviolacea]KKE84542.1 hypothetical protein N479_08230 [Pseudoalteromonas luteoviolacea S4054]KZN71313.1 hypothetical protein N481_19190 [Pseudoalteromonas luteoviolacea S4047-1]